MSARTTSSRMRTARPNRTTGMRPSAIIRRICRSLRRSRWATSETVSNCIRRSRAAGDLGIRRHGATFGSGGGALVTPCGGVLPAASRARSRTNGASLAIRAFDRRVPPGRSAWVPGSDPFAEGVNEIAMPPPSAWRGRWVRRRPLKPRARFYVLCSALLADTNSL